MSEYAADSDAIRTTLASMRSTRERRQLLQQQVLPRAERGDSHALALLAEVARDPSSARGLRELAIQGLSKAGPPAAPYVRSLVSDGVVDPALPWALGVVGSPEDAQLLLPFFRRRGLRLRYNAALALEQLGAPVTHEGFQVALRDRRVFVRAQAMAALRERCTDLELLEALAAARNDVPWYRLLTRRYFTLWARGPSARVSRRRKSAKTSDW
jgi:HEAT repeat protein